MATLKEHQAAMVDLLANGSGIPASASRLAHAMHDVLSVMLEGPGVHPSEDEVESRALEILGGLGFIKREVATTPGLNDKALSKREKALKTDSPAKWPTPAEQRVKELENTIKQLKANNAKLKIQLQQANSELKHLRVYAEEYPYPEQAGCRKPDTQVCEHLWNKTDLYNVFECLRCGVQEIKK